ncbi:MAG: HEAT repeat domain-containing protein [Methanomicrobiales archaeon]|jgi:HEAT repeat protein|nr:HEAT repeat domain-containing protein [Methanomicrobiales archaeon]
MSDSYSTRSISEWIEILSAPDKEQRAKATDALVAYGETSVPALLAVLMHADWKVRYRAAEALGQIGSTGYCRADIVPSLVALSDDEKDHVRYMAAKGLLQIEDPRARDVFQKLRDDSHSYTRAMAEKGLGYTKHK